MMNTLHMSGLLVLLLVVLPVDATKHPFDDLPINQIQVIGTHNSYRQPVDLRVFDVMDPILQPMFQNMLKQMPEAARQIFEDGHPHPLEHLQTWLEYIQPPLSAQLSAGLRSLEFDLYVDHAGGRFSTPLAYRMLSEHGERDLAPLYSQALVEPGLKVLHIADVDFRSHCPTFRICLQQVRAWSDSNPGHDPLFILLEPKSHSFLRHLPQATVVDPFDARAFSEMDAAIIDIIGRERVLTPDDLRGHHPTLEAAALAGAWPTITQARGKLLFLLLEPSMNWATFAPYLDGRPNLEGRMAFIQGQPGMAHTAFVAVINALNHAEEISQLVRAGYLVRTHSDIDTGEARTNDTTRRETALSSGAQIISTDYPFTPNVFRNSYVMPPFPEGMRINPVNARSSGTCVQAHPSAGHTASACF